MTQGRPSSAFLSRARTSSQKSRHAFCSCDGSLVIGSLLRMPARSGSSVQRVEHRQGFVAGGSLPRAELLGPHHQVGPEPLQCAFPQAGAAGLVGPGGIIPMSATRQGGRPRGPKAKPNPQVVAPPRRDIQHDLIRPRRKRRPAQGHRALRPFQRLRRLAALEIEPGPLAYCKAPLVGVQTSRSVAIVVPSLAQRNPGAEEVYPV